MVSNILCGMKNSESQSVQEISACQKTHDWSQSKTCTVLEKVGDLFQLRDFLIVVTTVLNQ